MSRRRVRPGSWALAVLVAYAFAPARATSQQPQPQGAAGAERLTDDLRALFGEVGDAYVLAGELVPRSRDAAVLADGARDRDPEVRQLATLALGFARFTTALADGDGAFADDHPSAVAFRAAVLARLARELVGERAALFEVVADLAGPRGEIARTYEQFAGGFTARLCDLVVLAESQAAMAKLQRRLPPAPALPRTAVATQFAAVGADTVLELRNDGDDVLHDCVVLCRYRPDVARVMADVARCQEGEAVAWLALDALGVTGVAAEGVAPLQRAQWAMATLEQGGMVYVPRWEPGAALRVALANTAAIEHAAGSATLSLWSDEGALLCAVPLEEARTPAPAAAATEVRAADPAAGAPPRFDPPADGPFAADLAVATAALDRGAWDEAERRFRLLATALGRAEAGGEDAARLLALARARRGEALAGRGFAKQRATSLRGAFEDSLAAADAELERVAGADFGTAREGSSLRAATLLLRLRIHALLCDYNRELVRQHPDGVQVRRRLERSRALAARLVNELEERHERATCADGRSVLAVVRTEVAPQLGDR